MNVAESLNATLPEFYTKRGHLTRYALACGYVEKRTTQQNRFQSDLTTTTLYRDAGTYHVRSSGPNVEPHPLGTHRTAWDVADTLTEARRLFAQHKQRYHK